MANVNRGSVRRSRRRLSLLVFLATLPFLVAACGEGGIIADAQTVKRGAELYQANCQVCHGDAATGRGRVGNAPPHGPTGHTWHHADGQLTDIILGRLYYPGRTMPSFEGKLTEEDVQAILAYFKTNWTASQRAFQEEVTRNWEGSGR